MTAPPFAGHPDLASRAVGGSVVAASDDLFAERENLINPSVPRHDPHTFGHKGQVYDGWETRRHREPGNDWALVRLGIPGVITGVVVDTAFFTGNYPPEVSVEATGVEGYPSVEELLAADWEPILPRVAVKGDSLNPFDIGSDRRFTHVRLTMFPDGGIARLRVHGSPVPDPRQLAAAELDLAALVNGGSIAGCSNMFYSSPNNLISPGEARTMGEGWETARRRDGGNDWVEVELAGAGVLRQADIDTSYFVGNSPGWASLTGFLADGSAIELLPRTRLQPDTVHRLRLDPHVAVSRVRIDVFPDGGLARLRLHGTLTTAARADLAVDWFNRLPASQAAGISAVARPIADVAVLPDALRAELGLLMTALASFNALPAAAAVDELLQVCHSRRWAEAVAAARPFTDLAALQACADETWVALDPTDWLEALEGHPRIGESGGSSPALSRDEQSGLADAAVSTRALLAQGNLAYEERFGHVFLISAAGRTPDDILASLLSRLDNDPDTELRVAAEQHRRITRLRLEKLFGVS